MEPVKRWSNRWRLSVYSGHSIWNFRLYYFGQKRNYNLFFCSRIQDMSENNMNQQPQSQPQQMQQAQQAQATQQQQQQNNQNQDLANCDLANLESLNCNDSDELLRQLTENTFELETFFSEFSTADIKVGFCRVFVPCGRIRTQECCLSINRLFLYGLYVATECFDILIQTLINDRSFQEENNNDVIDATNHNQQDNFTNCNDINVEANLAILQNRLLASASSKFGINLIRGESCTIDT